jgi:membrane protein
MADTSKSPYGFSALKETFSDFLADDALTQAAALAYYTALSFAPLLVVVTMLVGGLLGDDAEQRVVEEVKKLMGGGVGDAVDEVVNKGEGGQETPQVSDVTTFSFGAVTSIIGILAILYSASGVFAQLQAALNKIWDVEAAPGQGLWGFLRKRLLSVGVVFAILFLLLVTLAVTGVLNAVFDGAGGGVWQVLNFVISLALYVALFGLIFKYLPDVDIPWKAVWFGAALTAVLFAIGKFLIGFYLSQGNVGGQYGGAGSIVALLVWVYYSSVILFVGAEYTQTWAKYEGLTITPDEHARPETFKDKETLHESA